MIKVVNFPFCNFHSLERYLRVRSRSFSILNSSDCLIPSQTVLLPGVGTFGRAMAYLHQQGMTNMLKTHADSGGKFLGICLGMQLLFEYSEESPEIEGLGLISGGCQLIPADPLFNVPHIGWNSLKLSDTSVNAFASLVDRDGYSKADFYFVHSYVVKPIQVSVITASVDHPSGPLAAAVSAGNVVGFQFHPEKSGKAGYTLLDNVLDPTGRR